MQTLIHRVHSTFPGVIYQNTDTEKQLHNPLYGETRQPELSLIRQPQRGDGKKVQHTYDTPLSSTSAKHDPKEKEHDYDRLTRNKAVTGNITSILV